MLLRDEDLDAIFLEFIRSRVLPSGANPHPIFLSEKGGNALTKRVRAVLKGYKHCIKGERIDCSLILSLVQEAVERGVYIVGLDYIIRPYDLEVLLAIYHKLFK